MWRRTAVACTAALIVFGTSGSADASTCGGVSMATSKTVEGTELVLNGLGMREATMFSVDVYVAGLYVPNKSSDADELASSDETKQLVLEFVRDVPKHKIVEAYRDRFDNPSGAKKAKLQKLLGWLSAVEEGEEHVYTYVPGEGLTAEMAGTVEGTVEGSDFATTFFNIWLGSNPPNAGLKSGLLGGNCG